MITEEEKELMLEAFLLFNSLFGNIELAFRATIDSYNSVEASKNNDIREIGDVSAGDISTGLKTISTRLNKIENDD